MSIVTPVPDAPVAVANIDGETALVVADYHAGFETALRYDGVEIDSRAEERRNRLVDLIEQTGVGRVIFLGDLAHWIGEPKGTELDEIKAVIDAVTDRVPALLVKGNHDGKIEEAIEIDVTEAAGMTIGEIGFVHGHSLPSPEVLRSKVVCVGHEHATVRLVDEVGGSRIERVWLRGRLDPAGFEAYDDHEKFTGEVIVFPAFNSLVGGTWVNVDGQEFLSPMFPDGLADGELYLLDGARLGAFEQV